MRNRYTRLKRLAGALLGCAALLPPLAARAALSVEIQVYTDDINAPHEFGLELHVNTTPEGRQQPEYPGEVVPHHGLRITPEFSLGLTPTLEAGLYLPTNRDAGAHLELAGVKLRLKWLPIRGEEEIGGWFFGANGELSRLQQRYSESQNSFELRLMGGHRSRDWLVTVNPVFGWDLSPGYRGQPPEFSLSFKVARTVTEELALGVELYAGLGTVAKVLPANEQANSLFIALDWKHQGWGINFGIGRGLTSAADKTTVKAIFGIPI
jgi:hypothetical protein